MSNVKSVKEKIYDVTLAEYDRRCKVLGYAKGLSGLFTWLSAYEGLELLTYFMAFMG